MPRATTIQEVLKELDVIIEEGITTNSRLGLFAYIYRRTTAEIASEIALGNFEDNPRLEALDVAFANLYLDAYKAHKNNQPVSACWAFAFNQEQEALTILQHILLGMNAHINLDLAVSTASTMAGKDISAIDIDFSSQKNHLEQQFKGLYKLAKQTDKSFLGAVKAQEKKQLKGLENLEKRLLKAQKRKLEDQVSRITTLQNELFPGQSLQERNTNFSEFYLEYGEELIPNLIKNLEPLTGKFTILTT